MTQIELERLYRVLGYKFKQFAYLKQALTHCSVGKENNERYEFLGDSILNFIIAHRLFQQFPDNSEGQLSRLRAFLVKGEMLAEIANEIKLGDCLYLGQGEMKSGGYRRASILADALEAVIAAVYLDGGLEGAQALVLKLYGSRLDKENLDDSMKDYKTQLQEYLQAEKKPLPKYSLINVEGEDHEQIFHVQCLVEQMKITTFGSDSTRRKAEQHAAKQFLLKIREK